MLFLKTRPSFYGVNSNGRLVFHNFLPLKALGWLLDLAGKHVGPRLGGVRNYSKVISILLRHGRGPCFMYSVCTVIVFPIRIPKV